MKQAKRSSLTEIFERENRSGAKALVAFLTAGFPSLEDSERLVRAVSDAGADIIELGIPFSDPMADGATIQASSEHALREGTTLPDVLALVRRLRKKSVVPLILFGYYNPIFAYGPARFARDAARAGVDGLLVVDLPPEEAGELKRHTDTHGLDLIFLITPTSDEERMKLVAGLARGFVYFVAVTGVTGARKELPKNVRHHIAKARSHINLPIAIGFGISNPEQAATVSQWADGVIVGSAIIKLIDRYRGTRDMMTKVSTFVASLKQAVTT